MDVIQKDLDELGKLIKAGLSTPDDPLEGQRKYLESLGVDTRPARYGCCCILCDGSFSSYDRPSIQICQDCIGALKRIIEEKRNEQNRI